MRAWFCAVAYPKKNAAQALTTSPIKVSTLGLTRVSASQRTMVRNKTAQARPKALVQVICVVSGCAVGGGPALSEVEWGPPPAILESSFRRSHVVNRA